jgi:hypothetical protein
MLFDVAVLIDILFYMILDGMCVIRNYRGAV